MIDKICMFLTNKIRQEMTDVDDERAEVINYGLQNIIGEIPKVFILFLVAYLLQIVDLFFLTLLIILPYRFVSGGFHLKTHLGCILSTCGFYCGIAFLAKTIVLPHYIICYMVFVIWSFGMVMIKRYAPADTENVPILRKSERKIKKYFSYAIYTIGLLIAIFSKSSVVSNIFMFGYFFQTLTITKMAYRITKNRYGFEVYDTSN